MRPGLALYLGGTPVSELGGLDTPIGVEELVAIVPEKPGAQL